MRLGRKQAQGALVEPLAELILSEQSESKDEGQGEKHDKEIIV